MPIRQIPVVFHLRLRRPGLSLYRSWALCRGSLRNEPAVRQECRWEETNYDQCGLTFRGQWRAGKRWKRCQSLERCEAPLLTLGLHRWSFRRRRGWGRLGRRDAREFGGVIVKECLAGRSRLHGLRQFVGAGARPSQAKEPSRRWRVAAFWAEFQFRFVHRQAVASDEPGAGELPQDESACIRAGAQDSQPGLLRRGHGRTWPPETACRERPGSAC